jgi:hypothetical protein
MDEPSGRFGWRLLLVTGPEAQQGLIGGDFGYSGWQELSTCSGALHEKIVDGAGMP